MNTTGSLLPPDAISGSDWMLTDTETAFRIKKMEAVGIPLGEYVNGQIYYGVKTGFNTAFVIDGAKRAELIAADLKSDEIIKPLAVGDDIRRWHIRDKGRWLIVTKIGVDMGRYPAIMAHLSQWKTELRKRQDQGNYWWELRACAYYNAFAKPKIIYPVIGKEPRFAFDTAGAFTNDKAFIIASNDLYLLGILNSSLAWRYFQSLCSVLGDANNGGRLELRGIYVSKLPVPNASDADRAAISSLVQKCLDAKGVDCQAWEREIDERVAALYEL